MRDDKNAVNSCRYHARFGVDTFDERRKVVHTARAAITGADNGAGQTPNRAARRGHGAAAGNRAHHMAFNRAQPVQQKPDAALRAGSNQDIPGL